MKGRDLWRRLGIRPNSSDETIKKAYRRKALKLHPDKNPGDDAAAEEFRAVQEAFEVLSDPARRAEYERTGNTKRKASSAESELVDVVFPLLMAEIQAVGNSTHQKVEQVDMLARVRVKLNDQISSLTQVVKAMDKGIATIKGVIGRLNTPDGTENVLDAALRNQTEGLEAQREQAKGELAKMTRAKEYLATCTYRKDAGGSSADPAPLMLGFGWTHT